jgi:hypothetical protein
MSGDAERRFIHLGTFDGGLPSVFEIPMAPLQKIEQQLDAEHAQRQAEAEREKTAALTTALQSAHNRRKLRKLLHVVFRGRGR